MCELLEYIQREIKEEKGKRISLLPIVIAYDGLKAEAIARKLNSNKKVGEKISSCYGKHSENIEKNGGQKNLEYEYYCPVVFIYDIEKIDPQVIKGIYPFNKEEFEEEPVSDDNVNLESFKLGYNIENIVNYVEVFFGTNLNYFYGHLKDVKTSNAQISVIKALYSDSINAKVKTIYIELENIDIIDENLQCIILPERLLVFEEFSTLKSRPGVDVKTYETNTSCFVGWHNSDVSRLLKEYLIEKGKM